MLCSGLNEIENPLASLGTNVSISIPSQPAAGGVLAMKTSTLVDGCRWKRMDPSFPGRVGMGVGAAGTAGSQPRHCSDLVGTAEHPHTHRDRVAQAIQHGHPLPSYMPGEELSQALRKFWVSFEFWLIYSQVDSTIISFCTSKHSLIFFGRCRRVYSQIMPCLFY